MSSDSQLTDAKRPRLRGFNCSCAGETQHVANAESRQEDQWATKNTANTVATSFTKVRIWRCVEALSGDLVRVIVQRTKPFKNTITLWCSRNICRTSFKSDLSCGVIPSAGISRIAQDDDNQHEDNPALIWGYSDYEREFRSQRMLSVHDICSCPDALTLPLPRKKKLGAPKKLPNDNLFNLF